MNHITPLNSVSDGSKYCGKWSLDDFVGFRFTSAEKDALVVNKMKDYWVQHAEIGFGTGTSASASAWFVDSLKTGSPSS
jgi:hypothetical protein